MQYHQFMPWLSNMMLEKHCHNKLQHISENITEIIKPYKMLNNRRVNQTEPNVDYFPITAQPKGFDLLCSSFRMNDLIFLLLTLESFFIGVELEQQRKQILLLLSIVINIVL